jgi:hypothetical protein
MASLYYAGIFLEGLWKNMKILTIPLPKFKLRRLEVKALLLNQPAKL